MSNMTVAQRQLRVALAQLQPSEDPELSATRAFEAMAQAADQSAHLIAFPEIQFGPFFPQHRARNVDRYLMTVSHPLIDGIRRRCNEFRLAAFPNVYLEEAGRRYDATVAINPDGEIVGVSKMVHVVQAPQFFEQDYYTPSEAGFAVYHMPFGAVGVVICFDRHFPESIRTVVLRGAELVLIPTANAIGEPLEVFDWELRVAAVQNGVFVACCNRVGVEGAMHFAGRSLIAGPDGGLVAQAGEASQLLMASCDLGDVERNRRLRPYLALRRPDLYER